MYITKQQRCHNTQFIPRNVLRGRPIFNMCKIKQHAHPGMKDKAAKTHAGEQNADRTWLHISYSISEKHLRWSQQLWQLEKNHICRNCSTMVGTFVPIVQHIQVLLTKVHSYETHTGNILTLKKAEVDAEPTPSATPVIESLWKPSA